MGLRQSTSELFSGQQTKNYKQRLQDSSSLSLEHCEEAGPPLPSRRSAVCSSLRNSTCLFFLLLSRPGLFSQLFLQRHTKACATWQTTSPFPMGILYHLSPAQPLASPGTISLAFVGFCDLQAKGHLKDSVFLSFLLLFPYVCGWASYGVISSSLCLLSSLSLSPDVCGLAPCIPGSLVRVSLC